MTQPFIRADLTRKLTEAEINLIRDNYSSDPLMDTYNVGVADNDQGTSTLIVSYNIASFNMDLMLQRDKDIMTKAPSIVAIWRICSHLNLPYSREQFRPNPIKLNGARYYRVETLFHVEISCICENMGPWNDPFHKVPEDVWLPCFMEFKDNTDEECHPVFRTDEDMAEIIRGVEHSINTIKMLIAE